MTVTTRSSWNDKVREPVRAAFQRQTARLGEPVSSSACVIGWMVATLLLLGSLSLWYAVGGLPGDAAESVVPAIAIEHGTFACAYPSQSESVVPPLYPLLSAGIMKITGVGTRDIPPVWDVGIHCQTPQPIGKVHHYVVKSFLVIGLIGWPVLLGGFVALLRAAGRGRCRWELVGACLLGITPQVAAPLVEFFHPEDLLAMGLIFGALAMALRHRWLAAGAMIGLACCAKQYALLAAIPLVVAAPSRSRLRLMAAALAADIVVLVPMGLLMGHGMVNAVLGKNATPTGTETAVGALGIHGISLLVVSRFVPLALAAVLAFWVRSRRPSGLLEPPTLVALIATSLALRLVFEVNLYDYYFMALAVSLLAFDIVNGRIRPVTLGWILAVTAFYPPKYEPLVIIQSRYPIIVQLIVVLAGLAIASVPLLQASRTEPLADQKRDPSIDDISPASTPV